jgi:hypothetical protein
VTAINRDNQWAPGGDVLELSSRRPVTTPSWTWCTAADRGLGDVLTQAQGVRRSIRCSTKYLRAIGEQNVARITSFVATGKSVSYRGFGGGGVVSFRSSARQARDAYQFPRISDRGVSAELRW